MLRIASAWARSARHRRLRGGKRRDVVLLGRRAPVRPAPAFGHQGALRVLSSIADDVDHPVEVQIGDDEALRGSPAARRSFPGDAGCAASAHRGGGRGKARSTSFSEQTLGTLPSISTFMLSGMRTSRSVLRNSIPIQHLGLDGAGAGLQLDAHVLGGFVAQHPPARGPSWSGSARPAARSAWTLHLIGNLGDDDLPGAPARSSTPISRADGSRRVRSVGVEDRGARFLDRAARRMSGPGTRATSASSLASGSRSRSWQPSFSSCRLCGGMLVAMPTAIAGRAVGQEIGEGRGHDDGSSSVPS